MAESEEVWPQSVSFPRDEFMQVKYDAAESGPCCDFCGGDTVYWCCLGSEPLLVGVAEVRFLLLSVCVKSIDFVATWGACKAEMEQAGDSVIKLVSRFPQDSHGQRLSGLNKNRVV